MITGLALRSINTMSTWSTMKWIQSGRVVVEMASLSSTSKSWYILHTMVLLHFKNVWIYSALYFLGHLPPRLLQVDSVFPWSPRDCINDRYEKLFRQFRRWSWLFERGECNVRDTYPRLNIGLNPVKFHSAPYPTPHPPDCAVFFLFLCWCPGFHWKWMTI